MIKSPCSRTFSPVPSSNMSQRGSLPRGWKAALDTAVNVLLVAAPPALVFGDLVLQSRG